ncbi:MAG TPA: MoaD/ThiS family protein [Candidatus Acidoferrales bacterium]|nr:MoaD/ThiS family protein [Candidatus Acidoferrales bacterium]
MNVRVLSFARVREVLSSGQMTLDLADGATAADLWSALERGCPPLRELAASTRIARNGRVVDGCEPLRDGDEIALLPPVGGG